MTLYFHPIPCSQNWNWTLHSIATSVLQPLIPSFNAQAERLEELPAAKVPMPWSGVILIYLDSGGKHPVWIGFCIFGKLQAHSAKTLKMTNFLSILAPTHHNSRAWWGPPLRPSRLLSFSIRSTAPGRATAPLWSTPNLSKFWGLRHPQPIATVHIQYRQLTSHPLVRNALDNSLLPN